MHDQLLHDYDLRTRSGCVGAFVVLLIEAVVVAVALLVWWLR